MLFPGGESEQEGGPRSELRDPEHRHSLHELIGQDEDPEKG